MSQSLSLGQQSQGSEFLELDRFLYKSIVLNLSNIGDIANGLTFCTVGTTLKLVAGKGDGFTIPVADALKRMIMKLWQMH